ncbi:MAG: hypothetical protein GXO32_01785 [Crenarchaeota archaeon]|nr:hypothetical protein [Thermoproteota archaeon]
MARKAVRARILCGSTQGICHVSLNGTMLVLPMDVRKLWGSVECPSVVKVRNLYVVRKGDPFGRAVFASSVRSITALKAILDAIELIVSEGSDILLVAPKNMIGLLQRRIDGAKILNVGSVLRTYIDCQQDGAETELYPGVVYVGELAYLAGSVVCHLGAIAIGFVP